MADVKLDTGEVVTAHVPNSGSMKTCLGDSWPVLLSRSNNPKRKLAYTLELIHSGTSWIGVNTGLTNHIVREAIEQNRVKELGGYETIRSEVVYGENSRIDLLLEKPGEMCYIEIKSVTLLCGKTNCFPDAVTERGNKHLHELIRMKDEGHRSILFYLIQREDGRSFRPAIEIDSRYAQTMELAWEKGVEFLAYRAKVREEGIRLDRPVQIQPPPWKLTRQMK